MIQAAELLAAALETFAGASRDVTQDECLKPVGAVGNDLSLSLERLRAGVLSDGVKHLHEDGLEELRRVRTALDQLEVLRHARNRAQDQYDVHRDIVAKKEADYAKKGRSLSESKNYGDASSRRETSRLEFEAAAKRFDDAADQFTTDVAEMVQVVSLRMSKHMGRILDGYSDALKCVLNRKTTGNNEAPPAEFVKDAPATA